MKKIWQKQEVQLLKEVEKFTVGDDYLVDMHLVKHDIMGSIAHSRMLEKIQILTEKEQQALEKELQKIYREYEGGEFLIFPEDEDVHTRIEKILTERLGDPAKKLHTARSRNDQVLTDLRLFNKEKLLEIHQETVQTVEILTEFAKNYQFMPMCGYTHMQRAMPSSVGQWVMAFAEELLDLFFIWDGVFQLNNMSPLGSGAGFGISIDVDREMTAREMGFSRVQTNPIYCQNSRGRIESQILNYLSAVALTANKIATDLVLFTTAEFGFFKAGDSITTGSSIMPQKKNLDVMELMRGKTFQILGAEATMKNLVTNLISGYHRDLQDTKKLMIQTFSQTAEFLRILRVVFQEIEPIAENLLKALDKTVFATDYAYEKVKQGMPFREAYREVGSHLEDLPQFDIQKNLESKKHPGATGNLCVNETESRLTQEKIKGKALMNQFRSVEKNLLGEKK
jgi:argininosuccinate lyase